MSALSVTLRGPLGVTDELNELFNGRDDAVSEADRVAGRARIGGLFFSPNYVRSYQRASQVLVHNAITNDAVDELAVACLYLQRHVLELALKALIGMFHEIIELEMKLAEVDQQPLKRPEPSSGERKRLHDEHRLDLLLPDLRIAWEREVSWQRGRRYPAQIRPLPPGLDKLVADFCKLEDQQPSRFRYPVVRHKKDPQPKRSFPKLVTLPVRELQERLDEMIILLLGYPDELDHTYPSPSDTSLGHDLANLIDSVRNAIDYSQPPQPLKPFTDAD